MSQTKTFLESTKLSGLLKEKDIQKVISLYHHASFSLIVHKSLCTSLLNAHCSFRPIHILYSTSRKKWRWPKVFCFWIILYNSQLLERASQGGKWSYRITVVIIHTHLLMWHYVTKLEVDITPCSQQFSITRLSSWSKSSQW